MIHLYLKFKHPNLVLPSPLKCSLFLHSIYYLLNDLFDLFLSPLFRMQASGIFIRFLSLLYHQGLEDDLAYDMNLIFVE